MIRMLTLVHKQMIDIYKHYADSRGFMNFDQFINFCSDHDIFPYSLSKAMLFKLFSSLSFFNEVFNQSQTKSQMFSTSTTMKAHGVTASKQSQIIDEHLFVETLALCAFFADGYVPAKDEEPQLSDIKKLLIFMEKLANSEGVYKRVRTGNISDTIKCNLMEKKDILEPFRMEYEWYFRAKYFKDVRKKNFEEVFEMESLYSQSQILE